MSNETGQNAGTQAGTLSRARAAFGGCPVVPGGHNTGTGQTSLVAFLGAVFGLRVAASFVGCPPTAEVIR